ncbi:hypothetical protein [Gillisia sp. JM1]|uniref:hypothetical protein n=1 Tax=Gillisia sp. JM1 TaxID=1283286 RepID=UPI00047BF509|nr:hypothetical protein [Gillisia sp. JM1]
MISLILLIPWIIFNYKNPNRNLLGLNQSKKSMIILVLIELIFFSILYFSLPDNNPDIAGSSSFAWNYYLIFYAKGIIPTSVIAENINGNLGDQIDKNFQIVYLIMSLIIDYLILFIFSPNLKTIFKVKSASA